MNSFKHNQGFSLIELLVVVAIIGVLTTFGFISYKGYVKSTKRIVTDQNCQEVIDDIKRIWIARHLGRPCYLINSWGDLDTRSDMCTHGAGNTNLTAQWFVFHYQKILNPYVPYSPESGIPIPAVQTSCSTDNARKPGCIELYGSSENRGSWQNPAEDLSNGAIFENPTNTVNCDPYCRKDEFIFQCYNLDTNGNLFKYREHYKVKYP